jgi:hypothetical protein
MTRKRISEMNEEELKEKYDILVEALTNEMGGEYLRRLTDMREELGYTGLEYVHDPGLEWDELSKETRAALNVAGLEYGMVMQDELDITDLTIGSFQLSIESGHWWLTAARCYLYELTGQMDWRKVIRESDPC